MKFQDPMPVACPNCGKTYGYRVDDLLNFRAFCFACKHDLTSTGKVLRESKARINCMWGCIFFVTELGGRLGIEFEDEDLKSLQIDTPNSSFAVTLKDVLHLTVMKLSPDYDVERVKEQIFETVTTSGKYPIDQLYLDMRLVEALGKEPDMSL